MTWRPILLLASAARTADVTTAEQVTPQALALRVFINVTSVTSTPSVVPNIRVRMPYLGGAVTRPTITLLAGAAITATGQTILQIGPLSDVANLIENSFAPSIWDVFMDHADADSITYTVMAEIWVDQ